MHLSDAQLLFGIRLVHTLVYIANGGACFVLLYAGVTGRSGTWLWVAIALIVAETGILFLNRVKCPSMSPLAEKYGARQTAFFYDTFIPERLTRYTVPFFSVVVLTGLASAGLRWAGVIG